MRSAVVVVLVLALSGAATGVASAGETASFAVLDSTQVRLWRADLEFLRREMPKNHANLFHAMTPAEFDGALAAISSRLPTLARHQAIVELMRLDALVQDGHSNLSPWRDTVVAFHTLPIVFYRFGDGYFVRSATPQHASLLGARVTAIAGVPIDSAEALVTPLIGRDNAMAVRQYAPSLLRMPEVLHAVGLARDPARAELTLEQRGRKRTVTLAAAGLFPNYSGDADKSWNAQDGWVDARDGTPSPLWLSRTRDTYWYAFVPEVRALYVQLNEIQQRSEPFEAFFARAFAAADSAGADRLVLDLRLNGGGNGYFNVPIVRAIVRSRFDEAGKLFVVTNRRTFSAAQMLIDALERWSHPIFVGEPSASRGNAYGDSRRLRLPNAQVTVRVSTLYWQDWDPRDTRPWIAPDVAAPLTFEAYRAGRDPALEAIARWSPGPTLAERLGPLVAAGDSAAVRAAIDAFRADPVNAWLDPADALDLVAAQSRAANRPADAALADRLRARLAAWRMPD
jgi:hypothetical protein